MRTRAVSAREEALAWLRLNGAVAAAACHGDERDSVSPGCADDAAAAAAAKCASEFVVVIAKTSLSELVVVCDGL